MNLRERYEELRREATILAGEPSDISQRAVLLHQIYLDSLGNHSFAEIATHGALWAFCFFESTGTLGKVISYRYALNRQEVRRRHAMLQTFSDGFKSANRSVFIDTYSNFYFARELANPPDANVRFAYFPKWTYFRFKNFGDTEERIQKAHKCFFWLRDRSEGAIT